MSDPMDIEPTIMDDMINETTVMDLDDDSMNLPSVTSFSNEYENLPAGGPVSHAHIINLDEYAGCIRETGAVQLQDAVVTTLFKTSPDTLKSFLDPTVNSFKAVFGTDDMQLVVWRKGVEVLIGKFEHHKSLKVYGFEHVAGFLIGYDGSWNLKVIARNAYCNAKWTDVWAGKFDSYGGLVKMYIESEELGMAKTSSTLAESILENMYWEFKANIKAT
ncbi:hypothetical protein N0V83_000684 [Neocucurbitaria cava]|uniref:Uncharacterized protein n=1 Tax=Neocucurbitaria cava TaxID=798079 RepID=A0A9W8YHR7_9PLEO|nr:hypothetical protein N0V83_000684 [Neocucurbitaria cava]